MEPRLGAGQLREFQKNRKRGMGQESTKSNGAGVAPVALTGGVIVCMQSPEARARMDSETQPSAPATGEACFDIQVYDGEGVWLGTGGVFPLSWIEPTRLADSSFRNLFDTVRKMS